MLESALLEAPLNFKCSCETVQVFFVGELISYALWRCKELEKLKIINTKESKYIVGLF